VSLNCVPRKKGRNEKRKILRRSFAALDQDAVRQLSSDVVLSVTLVKAALGVSARARDNALVLCPAGLLAALGKDILRPEYFEDLRLGRSALSPLRGPQKKFRGDL